MSLVVVDVVANVVDNPDCRVVKRVPTLACQSHALDILDIIFSSHFSSHSRFQL